MTDLRRHMMRVGTALLPILLLGVAADCSKNRSSSEVVPLEGKVEKIVVNPDGTGSITVVYFSEKHNQEIAGTGIVTKNTEIMIDGAIAPLSEIREGEHVRGEVRIERKGDTKEQYALKITVERAKPLGGSNG